MKMKTTIAERSVLLLLIALAASGCHRSPTPAVEPVVVASPPAVAPAASRTTVFASGTVVPVQQAELSFSIAGRVQTVAAASGDEVLPGQVLVTLETGPLEATVQQAEAALAVAQAEWARVAAGSHPGQVAIVEARLRVAEAALRQAAAQRDQPDLGATAAEVSAAQAHVTAATADRLVADNWHERTMECFNVRTSSGEKRQICPALGPIEERARADLQALAAAQTAAQAQLDALLASAGAEQAAAQAGVSMAAARRDAAQSELDTLQAGAAGADVDVAEAAVAHARAAVRAARAALDEATLRAPFAGAVAAVEVSPGEALLPGQMVLALADLRRLQVETTDLSEQDVARVAVGQQVTVYVEALDVEAAGEVVRVASQSETLGGDVVYVVAIALAEQPPGLRWGMSVEVEIAAEQRGLEEGHGA
jgi:multidrug efflux pump subunit AcrA (membrane-fusion protein)